MNKKNILILLFFTGCVLIMIGVFMIGWTETWRALLVPTMYPPFADLRTVQGSISSIAQGFNPQLINPGDPWKRAMNYPSVWIDIAKLFSLNKESNYLIFVSIYVLVYIVICYNILRKYPSIWMLIAIFSGSSLLAIERGNNDLIIFDLLYLSSITPVFLSGAIIVCASLLKIYPVFSVVSFHENKKLLLIIIIFLGIYFLTRIPELHAIKSNTPTSYSLSYGIPSIVNLIKLKFNLSVSPLAIALCMAMFAIIIGLSNKIVTYTNSDNSSNVEFRLFLIGASIYLGTFVFSSNWDYRLIFLIFCIPFIEKFVNDSIKIPLLILMVLSSNQIILTTLLGKTIGGLLCVSSKLIVFLYLILLVQHNLNKFIDIGLLSSKFKK